MDGINVVSDWKPADRRQIRLIKAWEELALRQKVTYEAVRLLLLFILFAYFTVKVFKDIPDMEPWMTFLVLILAFIILKSVWGRTISMYKEELWGGRIYTCSAVCIGRTVERYRLGRTCYMDIRTDDGGTFERIRIPAVVMDSIRIQDRIMAVANHPDNPSPIRLYPFHFPSPANPEDLG